MLFRDKLRSTGKVQFVLWSAVIAALAGEEELWELWENDEEEVEEDMSQTTAGTRPLQKMEVFLVRTIEERSGVSQAIKTLADSQRARLLRAFSTIDQLKVADDKPLLIAAQCGVTDKYLV